MRDQTKPRIMLGLWLVIAMLGSVVVRAEEEAQTDLVKQYVNLRLKILYSSTDGFTVDDTGRAKWSNEEERAKKIDGQCVELLKLVKDNPKVFGDAPDVFGHIHLIDAAQIQGKDHLEELAKGYEKMLQQAQDDSTKAVWEYCLYATYNDLAGIASEEKKQDKVEQSLKKARPHLEQSLKYDKKFFRAAKDLFELKLNKGEITLDKALDEAKSVQALFPDQLDPVPDMPTYYHSYWGFEYRLALIRLNKQDYQGAERALTEIIAKYGPETFDKKKFFHFQFFSVYSDLGVSYMQNNKITKAKTAFEKSLQLNDKNSNAYVNLGLLAAEAKDFQGAIENFKKASQINTKRPDVYRHIGLCYRELGKQAEAIRAFQKVLEMDTSSNAAVEAENQLKDMGIRPAVKVQPGGQPNLSNTRPGGAKTQVRTGITDDFSEENQPQQRAPAQAPPPTGNRRQPQPQGQGQRKIMGGPPASMPR